MQTCKKCHETKPISAFYKTYKYVRKICKKCENRRMYLWNRGKSKNLKIRAINYLGGKCCICGYDRCIAALEFAHKSNKRYAPTQLFKDRLNWATIKKELDKCNLKCANCHREEHFPNAVK